MRLKDMLTTLAGMGAGSGRAPWIWHIDRPAFRPAADSFQVHGWVAGDHACKLTAAKGHFQQFEWVERPDLRSPPDGRAWASGFRLRATASELDAGTLNARASDGRAAVDLTWTFREAVEAERKRRKIARIRQELLSRASVPRETGDHLDFLPTGAPHDEPWASSGYNYPDNVNALIASHERGWILDCGAGDRPQYFDNVVNLDITPYPATDVLADAESLPFRDASFDGVVTLATLEHVSRPWIVASELVRVLKPGGTLIADVPFLQPVHAFPHHYFNMTSAGLRSLFEGPCEIVDAGVPHYGHPIYTLVWFLQRYAAGLPAAEREALMQLRVMDLIEPCEQQLDKPYVTELPEALRLELASVTTIVARKR